MTRPSTHKSLPNVWTRMLGPICLYLVLETGTFVIVKYIVHATVREILGPYLAFAMPGVIFLLLVGRLWKWEEDGLSSARLAFAWGLSVALLFFAISAASFYSILKLRLVDFGAAIFAFGMMAVIGTAAGFFIPYSMTLERMSARVKPTGNSD